MKLFKILIISIISIFIFQSQLYGINLRCDFKHILYGNDMNGVNCGWMGPYVCRVKNSQDGGGEFHEWISEVIIKNKDVEIVTELTDWERDNLKNKTKRKRMEELNDRILKLESEVHQKSDFQISQNLISVHQILMEMQFRIIQNQ